MAIPADATRLKIVIGVVDATTNRPIKSGDTIPAGHLFQVTVASNGIDCAGQLLVSALGAPAAPPSVLVQTVPFIVGPAVGGNTATGAPLTANPLGPGIANDWKISASCNGAEPKDIDFDHFELFVQ